MGVIWIYNGGTMMDQRCLASFVAIALTVSAAAKPEPKNNGRNPRLFFVSYSSSTSTSTSTSTLSTGTSCHTATAPTSCGRKKRSIVDTGLSGEEEINLQPSKSSRERNLELSASDVEKPSDRAARLFLLATSTSTITATATTTSTAFTGTISISVACVPANLNACG